MMHFIGRPESDPSPDHKLWQEFVFPVISLITHWNNNIAKNNINIWPAAGVVLARTSRVEPNGTEIPVHMLHDQNLLAAYGIEMYTYIMKVCGKVRKCVENTLISKQSGGQEQQEVQAVPGPSTSSSAAKLNCSIIEFVEKMPQSA